MHFLPLSQEKFRAPGLPRLVSIISQALCMTYNEDVLRGCLFKEWNILQVFQLLASLVGLL